jgi:hypothetical protein
LSECINYYPANLADALPGTTQQLVWRPVDEAGVMALASEMRARLPQPLDSLEVAALLESMGITSDVAVIRYGAPDVFQLAGAALAMMVAEEPPKQVFRPRPPLHQNIAQTLADFLRGPLSLVAIIVLIVIVAAYREFGAWDQGKIMSMSLGITGSMFVTNGFVQAAARRSSIFWSRHNPSATLRYLKSVMLVAGLSALLAGLPLSAMLVGEANFSMEQGVVFYLTFASLSVIWLMAAALAVLEASAWFGLCLLLGLLLGGLIDRGGAALNLPWHLGAGTVAGFAAAVAVMFLAARRSYQHARSSGAQSSMVLPSPAYLLAEALPYFAYGTLYMLFVLLPHALGWIGRHPEEMGWLSGTQALELGLSLAMIPLLLASGVAENTSRRLWTEAKQAQANTPGNDPRGFGRLMLRFYRQRLAVYLAVLGVITLAVMRLFTVLGGGLIQGISPQELALTGRVFETGLLAFWLLGWGLFNSILSISLARPTIALESVGYALGATLIVGVPLALLNSFELAAVGFVAGAVAFVMVSSIRTIQLLRAADYYYYSSF